MEYILRGELKPTDIFGRFKSASSYYFDPRQIINTVLILDENEMIRNSVSISFCGGVA